MHNPFRLLALCWLLFTGLPKTFGQDISLADSVDYYYSKGKFSLALPFARQWVEKARIAHGDQSVEFAAALNSLGDVLNRSGNQKEAEPLLLQSLEIRLKKLGEEHIDVAKSYNNLGVLYSFLGNTPKTEFYHTKTLEIRKKILGTDHPDVAKSYNNLGVLHFTTGNFSKAESYYLLALAIRKKALGEESAEVGQSYNNLGNLYYTMGDFHKAEDAHLKALAIKIKTQGSENLSVGISYINLGVVYNQLGNFKKSEEYQLKAIDIQRKTLGEKHPQLAMSFTNLGILNRDHGNCFKAGKFMQKALEIRQSAFGNNHPEVAAAYGNLSALYGDMGNYDLAEKYALIALKTLKSTLGSESPYVANLHHDLGNYYRDRKKNALAEENLLEANRLYLNQLSRYFSFLSTGEKESLLNNLAKKLGKFESFCVEQSRSKPIYAARLYDQKLATKAILLSSSQKFQQRLRGTKDSTVKSKFEKWEALVSKIGKLYSSKDSAEVALLPQLLTETEILEKELTRVSENFVSMVDKRKFKWTDIRKKLKPGEAAIEMVRLAKYGVAKIRTDTTDPKKPVYSIKDLTDTIQYVALIVKPLSKYPDIIVLENGNELESKWINLYRNNITKQLKDPFSFNQFWKKIQANLGPKTRKVYVSPDGIYNSINLNTLQNPKSGKYLMEEMDIQIVTNTRDILTAGLEKPNPSYACLVGYPDYNASQEKRAATHLRERTSPKATYALNTTRNESFSELPGTKQEIENIAALLQKRGWQVESYLGDLALEETIKEVQNPRILHLATHGFFHSDSTLVSNQLIRSGLLFSGANRSFSGEKSEKVEDGILTAYEAMNLNLDNTDLVVLSACETGLGEIKNGEGVYGLQRAFKVAGARSIIMSLWKVDDEATQELMVSFYKNWLGSSAVSATGQTPNGAQTRLAKGANGKRAAFLKAQKELKAKYPNPYYWGAFVMVGE